jgi:hypothetical protein
MPAPPILEVYVLWHPDDDLGRSIADRLIEHFHGPAYAGLAGGAVEVYVRSTGWSEPSGCPRPLPFMQPLPAHISAGQITVVIPVIGRGMARAFRDNDGWCHYLEAVFNADTGTSPTEGPEVVAVLPLPAPGADLSGSGLASMSARLQALPTAAAHSAAVLAREVAQAIAQRIAREFTKSELDERVTVFVSHTKHPASSGDNPHRLVATVQEVLQSTHLDSFFDAHDIQVSDDWETKLDTEAARHALLMVRTDKYASRGWTQREVLAAKTHDIPIVSLYAVSREEQRGSFLMDHVPVVACPPDDEHDAIERALNRLVDEALKRALWLVQRSYLQQDGFDWLPVHAPEPVTLAAWLRSHDIDKEAQLLIMHPDPPLGPTEREVILDLCEIAGLRGTLEILTPRSFATRGGK